MTVGVCLIKLHLLEKPADLKVKRSLVNRLKAKIRQLFSVSLAEASRTESLSSYHFGVKRSSRRNSGSPGADPKNS